MQQYLYHQGDTWEKNDQQIAEHWPGKIVVVLSKAWLVHIIGTLTH